MKRNNPTLRAACIAFAFGAAPVYAQAEQAEAPPGKSVFSINDADPVSSVPSPADARRQPLEMGYLLMELSERAENAQKNGQHAKAAQYFRAVAKAVPDRATGFAKACQAHAAAKQWEEALEVCRVALSTEGTTIGDLTRFVDVMLQRPTTPNAQERQELAAVLERLQKAAPTTDHARAELRDLVCRVAARLGDAEHMKACGLDPAQASGRTDSNDDTQGSSASGVSSSLPRQWWLAGAIASVIAALGIVFLGRRRAAHR